MPGLAGTPARIQVDLPAGFSGPLTVQIDTADLGTPSATKADGLARGGSNCSDAGTDYKAVVKGMLQVPAGSSSAVFEVETCPNASVEPNERFAVNVTLRDLVFRTQAVILNNAPGGLNDTGVSACLDRNGAVVSCASTDLPAQDALVGRDVQAASAQAADGRAGLSYRLTAGCITDQVTGLTWAASAQPAATWDTAKAQAAAANADKLCGRADWRLPTMQELLGLTDLGAPKSPLMDLNFFTDAQAADHWSSDEVNSDSRAAWVVSFAAGLSDRILKNAPTSTTYTRLVSGGAAATAPCDSDTANRWVDHGDGTVTDVRTGLMWQQCVDGLSGSACNTGTAASRSSFAAASDRATAVNADAANLGRGYGDWRVPNRNELASLVQLNCATGTPAINHLRFPNTPTQAPLWTSTPWLAPGISTVWVGLVEFNDGQVTPGSFNGNRYLRLVRAGQ